MILRVLDPRNRLGEWLDKEPDEGTRVTVQEWLFTLGEDHEVGTPVPTGSPLPAWRAVVPGTAVEVTWTVLRWPAFPRHLECVAILAVRAIG